MPLFPSRPTPHGPTGQARCWVCASMAPRDVNGGGTWIAVFASCDGSLVSFRVCGATCQAMASALLDGMALLRHWGCGAWGSQPGTDWKEGA